MGAHRAGRDTGPAVRPGMIRDGRRAGPFDGLAARLADLLSERVAPVLSAVVDRERAAGRDARGR